MTTTFADLGLHLDVRPAGRAVVQSPHGLLGSASVWLRRSLSSRAVLDLDDRLRADVGLPRALVEPRLRMSCLIGW